MGHRCGREGENEQEPAHVGDGREHGSRGESWVEVKAAQDERNRTSKRNRDESVERQCCANNRACEGLRAWTPISKNRLASSALRESVRHITDNAEAPAQGFATSPATGSHRKYGTR